MVRAGHDCVLAVGFEKMSGNLRDTSFPDRVAPPQRHFDALKAADTGIDPQRLFPADRMSETTENVLKIYARAAELHMEVPR